MSKEITKHEIPVAEIDKLLDKGPAYFYGEIKGFINDCNTLFERMYDLYNECIPAQMAQIGVHVTITVNDEFHRKLLSKTGKSELSDWTFGSSGPVSKEEAAKAEKEMQL